MYLYSYPSTHGISGLAAGGAREQFKVRLKMMIKWTQRYTLRLWSCEFGNALGGDNRANLEAVIVRVSRYTWRLWLSEFRDALGGRGRANSQAVIERGWRYTWRPLSSEFGDTLGGRNRASLEMHWVAASAKTEMAFSVFWAFWNSSSPFLNYVVYSGWKCTQWNCFHIFAGFSNLV